MPSTVRLVNLFSQSRLNLSDGADTFYKTFVRGRPEIAATFHENDQCKDADMPRAGRLFVILVIWIVGSGWPTCALALNQILNIRHWVAPDHTRVVIDMTEDVPFTVEKGERMLAVDMEDTSLSSHLPGIEILNKPGVERVVLSTPRRSAVRVELFLPGPVQTTVFKLKKFQDKPYRIVVDLVLPDAAKQESEARERIKVTRKARVVVIDPGHGGDAPGAVGKQGICEKDVVLAIAKKLRDLLNRKEGYRAFLTRDGDYYVSFNKRLMIAGGSVREHSCGCGQKPGGQRQFGLLPFHRGGEQRGGEDSCQE
jgi:N-acetylmuramoyl-L-alanine amidase